MVFRSVLSVVLLLLVSCWGSTSSGKSGEDENIDSPTGVKAVEVDAPVGSKADVRMFGEIMAFAGDQNLASKPFSEIMNAVADWFIGTPYVAATLENEGPERLVVNLREMDCTTYVENVLAISLCIIRGETDFMDFVDQLKQIRYRGGVIDLYPSRLHYFTDWLMDNQKKGLIQVVSNRFGDEVFKTDVNFMSAHSDKYSALVGNPQWVQVMARIEKHISSYKMKYVTGKNIEKVASLIKDGDVIAFCSAVSGLDVSHVAIAVHLDDGLHFMHASSSGKQVVVSSVLLSEYVNKRRGVYGILVGRATKNIQKAP